MAGKRRPRRGFGKIRKLPSGRYQASYIGPDLRRHKGIRTFETREDAEGWLNAERRLVNDPDAWASPTVREARRHSGVTLRAFAPSAIRRRKVRGRSLTPRTIAHYDRLLEKVLFPAFGDAIMSRISPEQVCAWYDAMPAEHPTQRAHAYSHLHAQGEHVLLRPWPSAAAWWAVRPAAWCSSRAIAAIASWVSCGDSVGVLTGVSPFRSFRSAAIQSGVVSPALLSGRLWITSAACLGCTRRVVSDGVGVLVSTLVTCILGAVVHPAAGAGLVVVGLAVLGVLVCGRGEILAVAAVAPRNYASSALRLFRLHDHRGDAVAVGDVAVQL